MSDLKPCPFCNCEAHLIDDLPGPKKYYVECMNPACHASSDTDLGWSGAMERWNTRPIEDELHARIAELEGEVERVQRHNVCLMLALGGALMSLGKSDEEVKERLDKVLQMSDEIGKDSDNDPH